MVPSGVYGGEGDEKGMKISDPMPSESSLVVRLMTSGSIVASMAAEVDGSVALVIPTTIERWLDIGLSQLNHLPFVHRCFERRGIGED